LLPDPSGEKAGTSAIASRSSSRESRYMYYCFQILQEKKQVKVLLFPYPPAEKAGTCTNASRSSRRKSRYECYCFQILQQRK
jgi:hypothetical protein